MKKVTKSLRMPFIRDRKLIDLAETYVRTKAAAREHQKAKEAIRKQFVPLLEQGHCVARLGAFRVIMKKTPVRVYKVPQEIREAFADEGFRRSVDIEPIEQFDEPVETVEDREDCG